MPQIPANVLVPTFDAATDLTVERAIGQTTDAYGEPVPTGATTFTARMVVHQASRKQLERAGVDYGHDWRAFYSTTAFRTAVPGPPDVVQYDGARWQIDASADYGTLGGIWIGIGRRIE